MTTRTRHSDRGQATVELALGLPLLCIMVLGVLQVAVVVRHQLAVHTAARNGARAAAAAADPHGAAARAVAATTTLRPLSTSVAEQGGTVRVTVVFVDRTDVPLVGVLLPDIRLEASATMVVEPP